MGCTPSKVELDSLPKEKSEDASEIELISNKPKSPRVGDSTDVETISGRNNATIFEKKEKKKIFEESDDSNDSPNHGALPTPLRGVNVKLDASCARQEKKKEVMTTEKLFMRTLDLKLTPNAVSDITDYPCAFNDIPERQIQIYTPENMKVIVTANSTNGCEFSCIIAKGKNNIFPISGSAEEFAPSVSSKSGSISFEVVSQGIPGFVLCFISAESTVIELQIDGAGHPILSINYTEPLLD